MRSMAVLVALLALAGCAHGRRPAVLVDLLVQCTVASEGQLEGCAILDERPEGRGAGEAALEGLANVRLDPRRRGETIRLMLRMRSDGTSPEIVRDQNGLPFIP